MPDLVSRPVPPTALAVCLTALMGLLALPALPEERRLPLDRSERAFLSEILEALSHGTVGARDRTGPTNPPPQTITPPGYYSLSIDGDFDLGGYVFKDGYPLLHNDGGVAYGNTALGIDALISSTPGASSPSGDISAFNNTALGAGALKYTTSGYANTASGARALLLNTTGYFNTATGASALRENTEGFNNTAHGAYAMFDNTTGYRNVALGKNALSSNTSGHRNSATGDNALLSNTEGSRNTASGSEALRQNTTGSRNTGIGFQAGSVNSTGSNSIWIGAVGSDESNTLRIGDGTGTGNFQQNRAFISGIQDATLSGIGEQDVCVDDNDQIGPCSLSSLRFKRDVRDMGTASTRLFELRPVVFRYTPEIKDDAVGEQFGLIAEEVAEVYPALVTTDAQGRPFTVRHDLLAPLLLNELQKVRRESAKQQDEIERLRSDHVELERLRASVVELTDRLMRLETGQPEGPRPASRRLSSPTP